MQGRSTCSFRAGKVAALHGPLRSDKVVGSPFNIHSTDHGQILGLRVGTCMTKASRILVHVHVGTCMG